MFDRPILVYSNYCIHSKNFIQSLMKQQVLFESFIRLNIDADSESKKRPQAFYQVQQALNIKIQTVPTVILIGGEHVLSGVEAFKWLDYQIKSLTQDVELMGFNSNEMTSFSDNYSEFGSTDINNATEQSFKFFVDKQFNKSGIKNGGQLTNDNYLGTDTTFDINNPNKTNGFLNELDTKYDKIKFESKQSERDNFDQLRQKNKSMEHFSQQPMQNNSRNIDFTSQNFGLSSKFNNISEKSKDLDSKLDQLLKDREQIDETIQQQRRMY
jgi:hypothetical protein